MDSENINPKYNDKWVNKLFEDKKWNDRCDKLQELQNSIPKKMNNKNLEPIFNLMK